MQQKFPLANFAHWRSHSLRGVPRRRSGPNTDKDALSREILALAGYLK